MAWNWKWRREVVELNLVDKIERIEAPVYRSTGGPIFKVAIATACRMDCLYCPFRVGSNCARIFWKPEKLVRVFISLYRHRVVRGIFLTSGYFSDPDRVVEQMLEVVEKLRKIGYKGYVHVRLMPGTSKHLVRETLRLCDRVGLNVEAPSKQHFSEIAPSKGDWRRDIVDRLIYAASIAGKPDRIDTQFVVGASGESDEDILETSYWLVHKGVGRLHYSPYTPISGTPLAEKKPPTPQDRVYRLYQAWSLMRYYGFDLNFIKLALQENGMLTRTRDLKRVVAERLGIGREHRIDPLEARVEELLLVPGIGPQTARRIVRIREKGSLTVDVLRKILGGRWRKAVKYLDLSRLPGKRLL
ncbi:MAG TPA: radical SAM protein [Pyrodictium sp.]|nr:radical SAM protein [Pyrodictium sp.]